MKITYISFVVVYYIITLPVTATAADPTRIGLNGELALTGECRSTTNGGPAIVTPFPLSNVNPLPIRCSYLNGTTTCTAGGKCDSGTILLSPDGIMKGTCVTRPFGSGEYSHTKTTSVSISLSCSGPYNQNVCYKGNCMYNVVCSGNGTASIVHEKANITGPIEKEECKGSGKFKGYGLLRLRRK